MERIIDNGAVVSEYPPGRKGRAEYFARRNYLISSWSKRLLLVEASERSGALITADIARKQGKEVFALPSSIYSKTGVGTNKLISKGARIYTGPHCIVDKMETLATENSITVKKKAEILDLSQIESKIIDAIGDKRLFIQQISEAVGINQLELSQDLAELELKGVVNCLSGRYGR
jgi:DNA processing protein